MLIDFKIIETPVFGNITITADTQINNLMADEVVVAEKVTVRLFGTIEKTLVLKEKSIVIFHGTINGEIINEGGELIQYK